MKYYSSVTSIADEQSVLSRMQSVRSGDTMSNAFTRQLSLKLVRPQKKTDGSTYKSINQQQLISNIR